MHRPDFRSPTGRARAAVAATLLMGVLAAGCSSDGGTDEAVRGPGTGSGAGAANSTVDGRVSSSSGPTVVSSATTGATPTSLAPPVGTTATEGTTTVGDGRPLITAPQESPVTEPENTSQPAATAPQPEPSLAAGPRQPEQLRVSVVESFPHDPSAFTQGLVFHQGELYESTGLVGASSLRRVALHSGAVLASVSVAPPIFAEGLALVGDELIQLSWRSGKALVYGRDDLQLRRQYDYDEEGWGLCFDGTSLVHSDGTASLRRRDPATFAELSSVTVTDQSRPVTRLNELECVGGSVYANVWQTERIARIDATTGEVSAWIDASALIPASGSADDVLNGIAYDPGTDTFLLTGKRWSQLHRVTIGP